MSHLKKFIGEQLSLKDPKDIQISYKDQIVGNEHTIE
eukprot:CAMPEP_0184353354 /NCGR_PEP_ID=MMETSP1089-20130417/77868_1 /TAXON_ID=38269 ORGANISM="Gloeochaete wittrockiana, Strain SAG46.84" /NCGR_SAMPLE_ID=MMETSP1089 /ASSEMBLY_ACC=CAM_ASM_000445 /LENGTH=36 /DNA_ID= /DNA_START= /DNA_END= /DNA_ORIENTATION=